MSVSFDRVIITFLLSSGNTISSSPVCIVQPSFLANSMKLCIYAESIIYIKLYIYA